MKFLQFSGQRLDTGIVPKNGYKVSFQIRMNSSLGGDAQPIFGSGSGADSFCMWYVPNNATQKYYWRIDHGGQSTGLIEIDTTGVSEDNPHITSVSFGKVSTMENKTVTSPDIQNGTYSIWIGSVNTAGVLDARQCKFDFGEFIITNEQGVEVYHGFPVQQGSTEFSATPAPAHCFWDGVKSRYMIPTGGNGTAWYSDSDSDSGVPNTGSTIIPFAQDEYGAISMEEDGVTIGMNSKYRLFGADITSSTSQYKQYKFTLTGYQNEPGASFPPFNYDGQFYTGQDSFTRVMADFDTGLDPNTKKATLVQFSRFSAGNLQGRARMELHDENTGRYYNILLNPNSVAMPSDLNNNRSKFYVVEGAFTDLPLLAASTMSAQYSTPDNFNGGSYPAMFREIPNLLLSITTTGRLVLKSYLPSEWAQRAFRYPGINAVYRVRWKSWLWYQGVSVTITILNTPYKLK